MSKDLIYFEDLEIGHKIKLGSISVSKKEIISFAKKFDPQPFHTNEIKAKKNIKSPIAMLNPENNIE